MHAGTRSLGKTYECRPYENAGPAFVAAARRSIARKIARRVAVLLLPQRAAIGEARLLARDELEQRRLAALGGLARSGESAGDVLGPLDALTPAAHGAPQIRVAPADVTGAVLVVRDDEVRDLDGHGRVVEHDGENGDPAAHRRLEIEPGHAEGGVAHEVDAELVGGGELGADDEAEPGAERVRLAPAEIAARRDGPVEGQELVARAPRVVRDDGVARADRAPD